MARIAKNPLEIPAGVKVKVDGAHVLVEGPKGKETLDLSHGLHLDIQEKAIVLNSDDYSTNTKLSPLHGLTRSLLKNMLLGVSKGFEKKLEIRGVGFRAAVDKGKLTMTVGYSHPVVMILPPGITIDVEPHQCGFWCPHPEFSHDCAPVGRREGRRTALPSPFPA